VVEREEMISLANQNGISLVGVNLRKAKRGKRKEEL